MKNTDELKIDNKDIISFSGHIELIRQMRNIINHYEPLLPFMISEMTNKKIEDSKLFVTLNLLDEEISEIEFSNLKTNIDVNSVNSKYKIRVNKKRALSIGYDSDSLVCRLMTTFVICNITHFLENARKICDSGGVLNVCISK